MEENLQTSKDTSSSTQRDTVSFLKIDALTKGSHALSVFLKTNDIIVGVDKKVFRGTQKILNDILKEREKTAITIFRKNSFFNVQVNGPLGIKLLETSSDEDEEILKKVEDYLDKIDSFESFKEFEVFRGKGNIYNIIEVNEGSLFASLFPLIWFFHNRLYLPLSLILILFILLGTIEWWLFFASWIILTVYMSKGSMSLLRGYCLFNEMRMYAKIYSASNRDVQLIIRELDKKANFIFSQIPQPVEEEPEKNSKKEKQNNLAPQT